MKTLLAIIVTTMLSTSVYAEDFMRFTCPAQSIAIEISNVSADVTSEEQAIIDKTVDGAMPSFSASTTVEMFKDHIIVKINGQNDTKFGFANESGFVYENTTEKIGKDDKYGDIKIALHNKAIVSSTLVNGVTHIGVKFLGHIISSAEKVGTVSFDIKYEFENCPGKFVKE